LCAEALSATCAAFIPESAMEAVVAMKRSLQQVRRSPLKHSLVLFAMASLGSEHV
jgi:hypothetical protein